MLLWSGVGVPVRMVLLPTTSVTNQWLTAARAIGFGDADFAAVFQALARVSGSGAMTDQLLQMYRHMWRFVCSRSASTICTRAR